MSEVAYLDLDDLAAIIEAGLGQRLEETVADWGLLESAVARPQSTVFGHDAYAGIPEKAAALMHSLIRNHALVDGNKRLGTFAMLLFLDLNGFGVNASDDELFDLTMEIAAGQVDDAAQIAERLRPWITSE